MKRALVCSVLVLSALVVLPWGWAQQGGGFQPRAGRYLPGGVHGDYLVTVDSYTGRLHFAPQGEGLGGEALIVDLPQACMWRRPLARDVSGGKVLEHSLPSGNGANAPVFVWHPAGDAPGILDTRSNVHYALLGPLGPEGKVARTDLRLLTRSVRELKHNSKQRD